MVSLINAVQVIAARNQANVRSRGRCRPLEEQEHGEDDEQGVLEVGERAARQAGGERRRGDEQRRRQRRRRHHRRLTKTKTVPHNSANATHDSIESARNDRCRRIAAAATSRCPIGSAAA